MKSPDEMTAQDFERNASMTSFEIELLDALRPALAAWEDAALRIARAAEEQERYWLDKNRREDVESRSA